MKIIYKNDQNEKHEYEQIENHTNVNNTKIIQGQKTA